jgi:DNA-binding transcriptional LysR family regulator
VDRRELESFVVLAEHLHFSKAAGRLHITQPALSHQIARLEKAIGAQLFVRNSKQVALTDAGRVFLAETAETLRQLDRSVKLTRRAAAGHMGRLTVAFVEAAPYGILPSLMAAYSTELPDVMVTLQEMMSDDQTEALLAGRIDVGLIRPMGPPRGLERMLLHREPYVVVLPKRHPLARKAEVALTVLNGERLITTPLSKRRYIDSRFRPKLERLGIEFVIAQEVQQIHTAVGLVAAGLGIALVPHSVSRLRLDGVVYRPLARADAPFSELSVAWRPENRSRTLGRFLAVAERFARELSER